MNAGRHIGPIYVFIYIGQMRQILEPENGLGIGISLYQQIRYVFIEIIREQV
jgi:hypothetical protein